MWRSRAGAAASACRWRRGAYAQTMSRPSPRRQRLMRLPLLPATSVRGRTFGSCQDPLPEAAAHARPQLLHGASVRAHASKNRPDPLPRCSGMCGHRSVCLPLAQRCKYAKSRRMALPEAAAHAGPQLLPLASPRVHISDSARKAACGHVQFRSRPTLPLCRTVAGSAIALHIAAEHAVEKPASLRSLGRICTSTTHCDLHY
jgi:hypothetical protein